MKRQGHQEGVSTFLVSALSLVVVPLLLSAHDC